MTIKQQEAIDRNNRVIEYIESNIDIIKENEDLIIFFEKLKKDNKSTILSYEILANDKTGSNAKLEAKKTVCATAEELYKKTLDVTDLMRYKRFSAAVDFSYHYFYDASDDLSVSRLNLFYKLIMENYPKVSSVITKFQLDFFKTQIDQFYFTDGNTKDLTRADSTLKLTFNRNLTGTQKVMRNLLKCVDTYNESNPKFKEGVNAACGKMVYRGYRKKVV